MAVDKIFLADPPSRTLQYTSNNVISTAYTYETPHTWISDSQQIPLLQTNVPSHMNAASGLTFDPFHQIQSQQTTYMHSNTYEASVYGRQQSQQDSDTMQQNNYHR
ncbi:unnamed protein product [Rotaria sp. Silwood2]|nr:unnamed protein product [Rotaria sp. Silwood2]